MKVAKKNFFLKIFLQACFSSILLTSNQELIAQVQICELIYGEQGLERNDLRNESSFKNPWRRKCHKIGLEHDLSRKPLEKKPIYACCREPIGKEVEPIYRSEESD